MKEEQGNPINIFISYADNDKPLLQQLENHLNPLKQEQLITIWHRLKLQAGDNVTNERDTYLQSAHIVLFLISADFFGSSECYPTEVRRVMEKRQANNMPTIPLLLRSTDWRSTLIGQLQPLPRNELPVTSWPNIDEAFQHIATEIRTLVEVIRQQYSFSFSSYFTSEHLPYGRNIFFTGRDDTLKYLHHSLHSGTVTTSTQAISGLGGIGKTQTVLEYAYRYQKDYDYIFWVKTDSREAMIADMLIIAQHLQLPEANEQEYTASIQALKHWLHRNQRWLLIFDNADDLAPLQDFLPLHAQGHVLLTTRTQILGNLAHRVSLPLMDLEQGALFLLRRAGILKLNETIEEATITDQRYAKEIVHIMGELPLALDQAGAYIEETQCNLEDYLRLYHTQQTHLLKQRGQWIIEHPDPVATTWSLSFEKVQQDDPTAADLLRFCSLLDSDTIPEEIIIKSASSLGPTLRHLSKEPTKLDTAIRTLRNYSLIQRNPNRTLTLHRLVREVLKQHLNRKSLNLWAKRVIYAVSFTFPPVEYTNWKDCQQYIPLVQSCLTLVNQLNLNSSEAAILLLNASNYLHQRAQYEQAETFYQKALTIREQLFGTEHLNVAAVLHSMAHLYQDQGKYQQAEIAHLRELKIREDLLGPEHEDVADSLCCLGSLYRGQGKYEQAETFYQRALSIEEQALGTEHPATATILYNLALLYQEQGKYEQAETFYQRALSIEEQALGTEHPTVAITLHQLGHLYQEQSQYKQAKLFIQRALTINERKLGFEHPRTVNIRKYYKSLLEKEKLQS